MIPGEVQAGAALFADRTRPARVSIRLSGMECSCGTQNGIL